MSTRNISEQQLHAAGIQLTDSTRLYPALHRPGDAGLPMLSIANQLGRAVVALQGAHLMSFQPSGQGEMLWLSPKCVLQTGQPIRGGIPLCLPWFGPGPDGKTMHGFARVNEWHVVAAERLQDGATRLVMELSGNASTSALWAHDFLFRLEIEVGHELKLSLSAENRGADAAPLAFAFHTYFAVPHVAEARVSGLENTTYIDKMDNLARKQQDGEVTIRNTTDRVYLDVPARQTLQTGAETITIASDTRCAVVWNAWTNDANIPDLGAGNHVGYLCVERGDVADHVRTLAPGENYRAWMTLAC